MYIKNYMELEFRKKITHVFECKNQDLDWLNVAELITSIFLLHEK